MGKQQKPKQTQRVVKERGDAQPKPEEKLIQVSVLKNSVWETVYEEYKWNKNRDGLAATLEKELQTKNGTLRTRRIA